MSSSSSRNVLIAFLRNDLRLTDHPIFSQCTPTSDKLKAVTHILPVYVFDQQFIEVGGLQGIEKGRGRGGKGGARTRVGMFWRTGAHRVRFITRSVFDIRKRLQERGCDLSIWAGQPHVVLQRLVKALQKRGDTVHGVWMGREPFTEEAAEEERIRASLRETQVPVQTFDHRSLILRDDLPFPIAELPDVFTHFRKRVEAPDMFHEPLPAPKELKPFAQLGENEVQREAGVFEIQRQQDEDQVVKQLLQPLLDDPDPIGHFANTDVNADEISAFPYKGGETEALQRLEYYFSGSERSPAAQYKETRNGLLGTDYSTKFSASLALGLLSPRTIAQRADQVDQDTNTKGRGGGYWIIFELLWRDYFFFVGEKFGSKLFTLTGIEEEFNSKSAHEKVKDWKSPKSLADKHDEFVRWANAQSGVPLIDANMKELALTGFMSNRGRQNVASLLTKDLGYDWRLGAEWFESQLIDFDPASNYGNWQYVAGVGNDPRASRQFNPIKQGKDYDKEAKYIKTWLPVLKDLPSNDAHHPWTTDAGSPDGYPARPVCESPAWKTHYSGKARGKGGIRGGGGGGAGGRRGGGKGYNSHRGAGGRGSGGNHSNKNGQ